MSVYVTTDAEQISVLLGPFLAADPVRHTVLGSVRTALDGGRGDGWCATSDDGRALAVRSQVDTPVVLAGDWSSDRAALAEVVTLLHGLPDITGISGPVDTVDAVVGALGGAPNRMAQRLFRLDALVPPTGVEGAARPGTAEDRGLLIDWFSAFTVEARGFAGDPADAVDRSLESGRVWIWASPTGPPASMGARRAPIGGSARIGPVYTVPDARGHGYGSAVTAAATSDILTLGAVPVLFTDLANPVSNAIYQRLGYRPVADYASVSLR